MYMYSYFSIIKLKNFPINKTQIKELIRQKRKKKKSVKSCIANFQAFFYPSSLYRNISKTKFPTCNNIVPLLINRVTKLLNYRNRPAKYSLVNFIMLALQLWLHLLFILGKLHCILLF